MTALEDALVAENDRLVAHRNVLIERRDAWLYRADAAETALKAIRDRLHRPIHPYGDKKFEKVPEIEFLRDAYGEDLPNDILAIIDLTLRPERPAAVSRVYKRDGRWRVSVRGEEQPERFRTLIEAHWFATFSARVVSIALGSIPEASEVGP